MQIKTLVTDIDGTLTDGKINVIAENVWDPQKNNKKDFCYFKSFNTLDGRAISTLKSELKISTVWVTQEQIHFVPALFYGNEKLGIKVIITKNKLDSIKELCKGDLSTVAAVGNDLSDIPLLHACALSYCPADAHPKVKEIQGIIVLKAKGGEGVLAEIEEDLKKLVFSQEEIFQIFEGNI